jgi:hypothetical protein
MMCSWAFSIIGNKLTGDGLRDQMVVFLFVRGIYRLTLHPLAKFPGPKIAAATDAWYAYHW